MSNLTLTTVISSWLFTIVSVVLEIIRALRRAEDAGTLVSWLAFLIAAIETKLLIWLALRLIA